MVKFKHKHLFRLIIIIELFIKNYMSFLLFAIMEISFFNSEIVYKNKMSFYHFHYKQLFIKKNINIDHCTSSWTWMTGLGISVFYITVGFFHLWPGRGIRKYVKDLNRVTRSLEFQCTSSQTRHFICWEVEILQKNRITLDLLSPLDINDWFRLVGAAICMWIPCFKAK